jgi:peptidoglycan hydrolase-like protein with peptidoglycan-binding domain
LPIVSTPPGGLLTNLYLGSRGAAVIQLQLFLIQHNYLKASATGLFGSLTQKAVQSFQCTQNLICSGSPATSGWGSVGPKTRQVINTIGF